MRRLRAIFFDAGNTLLRMNYPVIAEHLAARGHPVGTAQVEEAELRARVKLDPHLAPGASTESGKIPGRYLGYLLTCFFFILTCALLGLVPGMSTATGSISVTAAR